MIWLIGNRGMLGREVEALLKLHRKQYLASDQEVDITSMSSLQEFVQDKSFSWIINCAAYTAVDRAEDEPELAFKINADGPLNIAQIALIKNCKLIHLSTDYVFDGTRDIAYAETDLPNPLGVYAASKYKGDQNIASVLPSHFIIRSAWLYGKQGANFVSTMLKLFKEKTEVRVVADQWGSPTYALDLAEAILHMIDIDADDYGIYNFTNAGRTNWHAFATAIYELAKARGLIDRNVQVIPITTDQYPTKAKRPQYSYLSKEKICRTFGIQLKPWRESLAAFLSSL